MSLRFSRVTLVSDGMSTAFLTGGVPESRADLEGWTEFEKFIENIPEYRAVNVHVETFLYGGEEQVDATPEEVAYLCMRIGMRPDFTEKRTEKCEETGFTFIKQKDLRERRK